MITLDYFLFDNRTWAPGIGHDWGIKAATGVLASRSDLRSTFTRYCAALRSDSGYLDGFGRALGGIRSQTDNGYLLCVTLETVDHFRRPSWAVYGLWCPTVATLEIVLRGDPVASAEAVMDEDPPPAAMTLQSSGMSLRPRRRRGNASAMIQAFDQRTTVRDVTSILLGAIRGKTPPPDILGITASSQLQALAQTFDVIYCHALDERSERAFERHQTAEPLEDLPEPLPEEMPRLSTRTKSSSSPLHHYGTWLGVAVAAVVLLVWAQAATFPSISHQAPLSSCPELDEVARLDPENLRRSPGYADEKTNAAFLSLLGAQKRITAEGCSDALSPVTAEAVAKAGDACAAVGPAYATDTELRRWCMALKNLESAAFSSRNTTSVNSEHRRVRDAAERTTS